MSALAAENNGEVAPKKVIGALTTDERVWAARFDFLKDNGYVLRPRYRPDWKPHWSSASESASSEDAIIQKRGNVLDAVNLQTGQIVFLKCVAETDHDVEVHRYLATLPPDTRNHCVPYLDVLHIPAEPGKIIIVLPLLRKVNRPPIESVREAVDFVEQTLEGLVFLHEHKVAHRDCNWPNIMMGGSSLFPHGWHPEVDWMYPDGSSMGEYTPSRTGVGGVRYLFIDFGISTIDKELVTGFDGQVRAPELSDETPYNPYQLDVYILGKAYSDLLVDRLDRTDFLAPLVEFMTKEKPSDRPSAVEAFKYFQGIRKSLGYAQLGQRLHLRSQSRSTSRWIGDAYYRILDLCWLLKNLL